MIGIRRVAVSVTAAIFAVMVLGTMALPAQAAVPAEWNQAEKPFRIYGNTYYVGTAGISAVLITSEYGHVLVDVGTADAAQQVAANIKALGFELSEVKGIVISHAHYDHVGGVAELQRLTGAPVYALRDAVDVLRTGKVAKADPQAAGKMPAIAKVEKAWVVVDDQLLGIGSLRLRVLATPAHAPGGSSWTWDACEGNRCLAVVYADSLSAVGAGKYRFKDHPEVVKGFEDSFTRLENAKCELLLTPHPEASGGLARLAQAGADADKLKDDSACKKYVQQARENLQKRLAGEG
ncbi:MAG: subclass B3 metallo-beta-lactamase [Steroidobacteraceae bacterium]